MTEREAREALTADGWRFVSPVEIVHPDGQRIFRCPRYGRWAMRRPAGPDRLLGRSLQEAIRKLKEVV